MLWTKFLLQLLNGLNLSAFRLKLLSATFAALQGINPLGTNTAKIYSPSRYLKIHIEKSFTLDLFVQKLPVADIYLSLEASSWIKLSSKRGFGSKYASLRKNSCFLHLGSLKECFRGANTPTGFSSKLCTAKEITASPRPKLYFWVFSMISCFLV